MKRKFHTFFPKGKVGWLKICMAVLIIAIQITLSELHEFASQRGQIIASIGFGALMFLTVIIPAEEKEREK
jgi:uncharacterized membrane protein YwzB